MGVRTCSFCKQRGERGYFRFPKGAQLGECLELAGLPPEKDLKVKVENLRICFRHYEAKAFFFNDGGQLRLRTGKLKRIVMKNQTNLAKHSMII